MRLTLLAFLAFAVAMPLAFAEEPAPKDETPKLASDAQAKAALDTFKDAFKARGLKGDEKLMQKEFAMRALAKVQHRSVIDALAKITRDRSPDVRTSAVTHLGKQRALSGYAGHRILQAMRKQKKDATFTMACLSAISKLGCLLADADIRELMKHSDYSIRKQALLAIGQLQDMRMLDDLLGLLKELKLDKGVTWEGAEATVDTGTAGDGDQKAAEAKAKAQAAKNKKAGRRGARSQRDIGPIVLEALKLLTGEEFDGSIMAKEWTEANAKDIEDKQKRLAIRAKDQAGEIKPKKK